MLSKMMHLTRTHLEMLAPSCTIKKYLSLMNSNNITDPKQN